jgi:hypothetical protein
MRGVFVTSDALQARLRAAIAVCLSAILIATTALVLWAAFRDGVTNRRDAQLSSFGMGHFVNAVCAILSTEKYRTGRYVCASAAQNGMKVAGLDFDDATLARIHMPLSEWLQNTTFLNKALTAAFSEPSLPWDGGMSPIGWGQDAGYQDYIQFVFAVFGKKVQAIYDGFFLLLACSAGFFVVQFYRRPFALFTLTAALYAIYDFFHSFLPVFDPGLNNPRTLTFLAVIPLLHAMFLILYRERPSRKAVSLFIPQAALMAATGDFLDLSYWTVIAISAMSLLVIGYGWWHERRAFGRSCLRCWPTAIAIGCVILAMIATAGAADHRLAKIGGMRMHSFWEPVFYDLQSNPEWQTKYARQFHNATGDATATAAVELYLWRHPIPANSPDYLAHNKALGLTQIAYEKYTRLSYIEFALNDPAYILRLKYLDLKTVIYVLEQSVFPALLNIDWPLVLVGICVALAAIFEAVKKPQVFSLVTGAAACLLLFALLAAAPVWVTVPEIGVMGGPFVITLLTSIIAVFWAMVAGGLAIVNAVSTLRHRGGALSAGR